MPAVGLEPEPGRADKCRKMGTIRILALFAALKTSAKYKDFGAKNKLFGDGVHTKVHTKKARPKTGQKRRVL